MFAHVGGAAGELPRRTEDVVLRLLAELAAGDTNGGLLAMSREDLMELLE